MEKEASQELKQFVQEILCTFLSLTSLLLSLPLTVSNFFLSYTHLLYLCVHMLLNKKKEFFYIFLNPLVPSVSKKKNCMYSLVFSTWPKPAPPLSPLDPCHVQNDVVLSYQMLVSFEKYACLYLLGASASNFLLLLSTSTMFGICW